MSWATESLDPRLGVVRNPQKSLQLVRTWKRKREKGSRAGIQERSTFLSPELSHLSFRYRLSYMRLQALNKIMIFWCVYFAGLPIAGLNLPYWFGSSIGIFKKKEGVRPAPPGVLLPAMPLFFESPACAWLNSLFNEKARRISVSFYMKFRGR